MMTIDELANVIKKEFSVQKIILFGSHAYGQPHKDSDVDICVIMETNLPFPEQAAIIRLKLREKIKEKPPIDLIVRTPDSIKEELKKNNFFVRDIIEKGKQL